MELNTVWKEKALQILSNVPDPEIPVVNVVELGIVRDVIMMAEKKCKVIITPTYSACPATKFIENEIIVEMQKNGYEVITETQLFPPWSTDDISDEAREKLRKFGIAPPEKGDSQDFINTPKPCPRCHSTNTRKVSQFGSTLCKASYQCNDCLEPFDYFKCH